MRDFGDGEGLRKILQDFAASRIDQQASAEKVRSLKKRLDMILEELASAHTNLAGLRQDGIEMVKKVGNIEELVGEIPEYKKRISTLSESVDRVQRATQEVVEDISKVQQKQERENADVAKRIECERLKERSREETNIQELEKLLRGAQEIELENCHRQLRREKQKAEEKVLGLEEENRLLQEKHCGKMQVMKQQLLDAETNRSTEQTKLLDMEVVRREMESIKENYEAELGELLKQIGALKERKSGSTAAKKKKVSFALPNENCPKAARDEDDDRRDASHIMNSPKCMDNQSSFHELSNLCNEGVVRREITSRELAVPDNTTPSPAPSAGSEVGEISIDKDDQLRFGGWDSKISRGGGVPAPHKSSFKFVSRAAGSSLLGEPSGFSTFSRQPQLEIDQRLAEKSCLPIGRVKSQIGSNLQENAALGESYRLNDLRDEVMQQLQSCEEIEATCENLIGRWQEEPRDEVDLEFEAGEGVQGHGKSVDQVVFEDDLKRRRLEGVKVLQEVPLSTSTQRSMLLGEDSGEGGDIVSIPRNEAPRAEIGQEARKPLKRKLYSETGNGPQVLE